VAKPPSWNAERIALARGLKAQGLTAKQAAHVLNSSFVEMPTLTRNAVIAKWDRLGLGKPHIISAKQIEAKVAAARAKARSAKPPKPAPKPIAPRLRADPVRIKGAQVSLRNVRFNARRADECAMFLPNEEGAHGLVCGLPATHGAWCDDCFRLVYPPVAKARAA